MITELLVLPSAVEYIPQHYQISVKLTQVLHTETHCLNTLGNT